MSCLVACWRSWRGPLSCWRSIFFFLGLFVFILATESQERTLVVFCFSLSCYFVKFISLFDCCWCHIGRKWSRFVHQVSSSPSFTCHPLPLSFLLCFVPQKHVNCFCLESKTIIWLSSFKIFNPAKYSNVGWIPAVFFFVLFCFVKEIFFWMEDDWV